MGVSGLSGVDDPRLRSRRAGVWVGGYASESNGHGSTGDFGDSVASVAEWNWNSGRRLHDSFRRAGVFCGKWIALID